MAGPLRGRALRDWQEEYDRRLNDPSVQKDKMKNWRVSGTEIRVADDQGVMRRRNGEVCCGCGKGHYGDNDHESFDLDRPRYESTAHQHTDTPPDNDDGPRGYFCSWI